MLSSTDDDDDASWSNLGTDLQGEEIVLEDVVGKKKTKEEFEEGDEKELEEKPQMTCGKKDDSPPSKEEEEKELEGIEDAWEGKDEEVRAWLELAEAQFDARTSPLIGAQQKQQTSHATTTKYETPTQGEGVKVQSKKNNREERTNEDGRTR